MHYCCRTNADSVCCLCSQYVSEIVVALSEAPMRSADIPAALEVCTALHHRYSEFASGLARALGKVLTTPPKAPTGQCLKDSKGEVTRLCGFVELHMLQLPLMHYNWLAGDYACSSSSSRV